MVWPCVYVWKSELLLFYQAFSLFCPSIILRLCGKSLASVPLLRYLGNMRCLWAPLPLGTRPLIVFRPGSYVYQQPSIITTTTISKMRVFYILSFFGGISWPGAVLAQTTSGPPPHLQATQRSEPLSFCRCSTDLHALNNGKTRKSTRTSMHTSTRGRSFASTAFSLNTPCPFPSRARA